MSLDDIRTRIEYVDGMSVAVIELGERMDILSSCFLNGGLTDTETIVIIQVDPEYSGDPVKDAKKVLKGTAEKMPSLTLSAVGLTSRPSGATSLRPLAMPVITLMF